MTYFLLFISVIFCLLLGAESKANYHREALEEKVLQTSLELIFEKCREVDDFPSDSFSCSDISDAPDSSESLTQPLISSRDLTAILGRSGLSSLSAQDFSNIIPLRRSHLLLGRSVGPGGDLHGGPDGQELLSPVRGWWCRH